MENEQWLLASLMPGYTPLRPPNKLLHTMFHIGMRPFDQVAFFSLCHQRNDWLIKNCFDWATDYSTICLRSPFFPFIRSSAASGSQTIKVFWNVLCHFRVKQHGFIYPEEPSSWKVPTASPNMTELSWKVFHPCSSTWNDENCPQTDCGTWRKRKRRMQRIKFSQCIKISDSSSGQTINEVFTNVHCIWLGGTVLHDTVIQFRTRFKYLVKTSGL